MKGERAIKEPAEGRREGRNRAATEEALEQAALDLLERDGVLAGHNLREVAALAGVNRGLVYHYFGSRQRLLRAALRRRGAAFQAELGSNLGLPFRARMARLLETSVRHSSTIALSTILMLDRDDRLRTMPRWRQNQELLDLDIAEGRLSEDIDPVGVHTAAVTAVYGYVLYREAFARELGIPVTELDVKVSRIFDRMLDGVAPPPPPAEPVPPPPRRGLRFGR